MPAEDHAADLHEHLVGLGFKVQTIRTRKTRTRAEGDLGGPYHVQLAKGATPERSNEAQAIAEAWTPPEDNRQAIRLLWSERRAILNALLLGDNTALARAAEKHGYTPRRG